MNLRDLSGLAVTISISLFLLPVVVSAADAKASGSSIGTKSAAVENESVPQSVFTVATNSTLGRNPFFPKSLAAKPDTQKPASTHRDFKPVLNGLGGTADNKLAIINNRTFAQGEEGEITSGTAHMKIRCVEIKNSSVVIELNGELQELRLRSEE